MFDLLLNRPSQADHEFMELILFQSTDHVMAKAPSIEELSGALPKLNSGKSQA